MPFARMAARRRRAEIEFSGDVGNGEELQRAIPEIARMDEILFGERRLTAKQLRAMAAMKGFFVFIGWASMHHAVNSYAFVRRYSRVTRVVRLAVAPGCHGRGIGRAVLNGIQDHTRKPLSAFVNDQWLGAQLFFQRCGFHAVGHPMMDSRSEEWYRFVRGVGWEPPPRCNHVIPEEK